MKTDPDVLKALEGLLKAVTVLQLAMPKDDLEWSVELGMCLRHSADALSALRDEVEGGG